MSKVSSMKYMCECGCEARIKPILMGFVTHCKKCGKEYSQEGVLQDVELQKSARKSN